MRNMKGLFRTVVALSALLTLVACGGVTTAAGGRGDTATGGAITGSGGSSSGGSGGAPEASSGGDVSACGCLAAACAPGFRSGQVPGQCCPACMPCGAVNCPNVPACGAGQTPVTEPGQCCPTSCTTTKTTDAGSVNCGSETCNANQFCVHEGCGGGPNPCLPMPEGGACLPGWTPDPECPSASPFGGCDPPPCTDPPPYCVNIPSSCLPLPTGLTGLCPCADSACKHGICVEMDRRNVTCGAE